MSKADPAHPVEILICVHNSLEDVQKCLASVMNTLRAVDRLVIVDDGSGRETRQFCESILFSLGAERCTLLRRPEGTGFCKAANAGLRLTSAETVIILNSDTIVDKGWIERLTSCMTSNWQIGIVGPLSNAGGWQSIPELPNDIILSNSVSSDPESLEGIQKMVSSFGLQYSPPIVEQINGFCFAVSREVLNAIGLFNEDSFPNGYGEENDFTFRALNAGFLCVVALDCFVFHAKTRSYTSEARRRLSKEGQSRLHCLHGKDRVINAVKQTQEHITLKSVRSLAREAFLKRGWQLDEPQ